MTVLFFTTFTSSPKQERSIRTMLISALRPLHRTDWCFWSIKSMQTNLSTFLHWALKMGELRLIFPFTFSPIWFYSILCSDSCTWYTTMHQLILKSHTTALKWMTACGIESEHWGERSVWVKRQTKLNSLILFRKNQKGSLRIDGGRPVSIRRRAKQKFFNATPGLYLGLFDENYSDFRSFTFLSSGGSSNSSLNGFNGCISDVILNTEDGEHRLDLNILRPDETLNVNLNETLWNHQKWCHENRCFD